MTSALEFMEQYGRMCSTCHEAGCHTCPLSGDNNGIGCGCVDMPRKHPDETLCAVLKWTAEHPKKTRLTELLKALPNLRLDVDGYPYCCVNDYQMGAREKCAQTTCKACKAKFWDEEVK